MASQIGSEITAETEITFLRRSGCTDLGKEYEIYVTTLLALRCVLASNTDDFWIGSNVGHVGDFDDIVLCRKTTTGLNLAYLIQVKHQEHPEKIANHSFTYRAQKGGNQKRQKYREDFSLNKYKASYVKMMEEVRSSEESSLDIIQYLKKCDEIFLIIFTNKLANENSILDSFKHQELDFLNTNMEQTTVFKFNHAKLNFDEKFLQHLALLSNQIHLDETRKAIEKEIKKFFSCSKLSKLDFQSIATKLIDFVRAIANKSYTLSKNDLIDKLVALALQSYELDFTKEEFSCYDHPGKTIWKAIVSSHALTVVDSDDFVVSFLKSCIEDEVKSYGKASKKVFWDDSVVENGSLDTKLINLTEKTTLFDIYHCLWFKQKVPLILSIQSNQDLQTILKLLDHSKSNLSVILLKSEAVYVQGGKKVFSVLNDLNEKFKNIVLEQHVRLQGRSSMVLDQLVSKSMYGHIKCKDIIYIVAHLYDVGYRNLLPESFVPQRLTLLDDDDQEKRWKNVEVTTWHGFKDDFSQLNIVTSNPGTGKSVYLTYLASLVPCDFWVAPISLNECEDYYYNFPNSEASTHVTYFHDCLMKTTSCQNKPLLEALFREFLTKRKVLILLDGFDEICPHFKNEVVSLITSLLNEKFNLWITTRPLMMPYLRSALEGFNPLFWTVQPFSVKEQTIYLRETFLSQLESNSLDEATQFSEACVESFKLFFYDRTLSFTSTPLHLEVLSGLFVPQYQKYGNLEVSLVTAIEAVISKKSETLRQKFGSDSKRMQIFVDKYCKLSALKATFPDCYLKRLRIDEILKKHLEGKDVELLQRDGVLVPFSNTSHKSKFTHRIFADFYVAQWLAEHYNSDENTTRNVASGIMKTRFGSFGLVFKILDGILAKTFKMKGVGQNWKETEGKMISKIDSSGKTVGGNLDVWPKQTKHLNSPEEAPLDFSEKAPTNVNAKDAILGYNTLDYAIKNCNFALANDLCQKYRFDLHISISSPLRSCILSLCVTFGLEHLFKTLLRTLGTRAILMDDYDLNYSIDLFCNLPNHLQNQNYLHYLNSFQVQTLSDLFVHTDLELKFAVCFGTIDLVESLWTNLNSLNEPDQDDNTLLFYSAKFGRLEILKMLLLNGANVNQPCHDGNAALHIAVKNNFLDITTELILNNANVNQTNDFNQTPLLVAVQFQRVEIINHLVQNSASFVCQDHDSNTLVHYAAQNNFLNFIAEYLLRYPESSNAKNLYRETPLVVALRNKNIECAHLLLLNSDTDSKFILHEAARGGFDEILQKLLLQGYNVDEQNQTGETALHVAIKEEMLETSSLLVKFGADCNLKSVYEFTPLHYAIQKGWKCLVDEMLSSGASLNIKGSFNSTPLHIAVLHNHSELAKSIVERGADVKQADDFGNTCLHYAAQGANLNVISLLCEKGELDPQNNFGRTPIHYAVINEQVEAAQFLLKKGSNLGIEDAYGKTCVDYARESNNKDLFCLFKGQEAVNKTINGKIAEDHLNTFELLDKIVRKRSINYEVKCGLNYQTESPKETLLMTFLMEYLGKCKSPNCG